jgi:2-polyprenyl-3-methyl-5-hydroxy-6-metoxy-1,4-benzoquinol methylase
MATRVEKKFWGLDCIIRHDYTDPEIQEKLKGYQKKSADAFLHFCTNVPNMKYGSFLDVGCGDDHVLNLMDGKFVERCGIDLYPGADYDNVFVADWYTMAEPHQVFYSDQYKMPYKFDGIFINHSMEHAENVYALMQQVSAMQDKDGALFVAVPDGNSPFGYGITSSTTHFSCITEGYLRTTLQRFGYNVEVERREFRPGAPEIWAFAIKQYDGFSLEK